MLCVCVCRCMNMCTRQWMSQEAQRSWLLPLLRCVVPSLPRSQTCIINPRRARACAARFTVVVLCVCV